MKTSNNPRFADDQKLFVGGLSWDTTEATMKAYFKEYGILKDCHVMHDQATKKSRGFGFITFDDPTVNDVVLAREDHEIDGKVCDVKLAVPRTNPGARVAETPLGVKKIFVGGLQADLSEDDVRVFFNKYGKVTDVLVMVDRETGRSRGFGFVTFESAGSVSSLCKQQYIEMNGKQVEVKAAQPKGEGPRGDRGGFQGGYGGPPPPGFGPPHGHHPHPHMGFPPPGPGYGGGYAPHRGPPGPYPHGRFPPPGPGYGSPGRERERGGDRDREGRPRMMHHREPPFEPRERERYAPPMPGPERGGPRDRGYAPGPGGPDPRERGRERERYPPHPESRERERERERHPVGVHVPGARGGGDRDRERERGYAPAPGPSGPPASDGRGRDRERNKERPSTSDRRDSSRGSDRGRSDSRTPTARGGANPAYDPHPAPSRGGYDRNPYPAESRAPPVDTYSDPYGDARPPARQPATAPSPHANPYPQPSPHATHGYPARGDPATAPGGYQGDPYAQPPQQQQPQQPAAYGQPTNPGSQPAAVDYGAQPTATNYNQTGVVTGAAPTWATQYTQPAYATAQPVAGYTQYATQPAAVQPQQQQPYAAAPVDPYAGYGQPAAQPGAYPGY